MKKINKNILIATGGTGGHIFPSLSLAKFLSKNYNLEIVSDNRGLKFLENNENIKIKIINSGTIYKKNFLHIIFGASKIITAFIYSLCFLIYSRPNLIIGMGGYPSFPICIAGFLLRIPVIIYENNLIIGRANKFLLPIVKKIILSTKNTSGINPKYKKKSSVCGYILNENIYNFNNPKKISNSHKEISILIMGGSQSAKIFGETLPLEIVKCSERGVKFTIYQQCLENQINEIKKIYKKFNIQCELFTFSKDMIKYYQKSDLAITRSGASSLAELTNLRIPFIAIPLPSSADNHQFMNANYFREKGYCYLLEEKFISDNLYKILVDLSRNQKKLQDISEKMSQHSDKNIFSKIEKLLKETLNE
mgnify:FL=1|tara:strand:+ start:186 stop:1277 length:1092 start_codon:yes stop_codon:yes gene_type:complete